jgi:hypothetical protein
MIVDEIAHLSRWRFFPANNILQVDSCRLPEPAFGRYIAYRYSHAAPALYVEFDTQHNQRTNARADSSKATDWRTETCGPSIDSGEVKCMIRSSARTSISVSSGRVQKKTNIVLSFPSIFQGTQKLQRGTLVPRTTSSREHKPKGLWTKSHLFNIRRLLKLWLKGAIPQIMAKKWMRCYHKFEE